jgi:hypothetical protein
VGYVGLAILLMFMFCLAHKAHKLTMAYKNTPWAATVMFLCIPIIVSPVYFIFVFGTFAAGAGSALIGMALIRIMERALYVEYPAHLARQNAIASQRVPETPASIGRRPAPAFQNNSR